MNAIIEGIKTRLQKADREFTDTVVDALQEITTAIEDIPLVGLSVSKMHEIETRGIAIAQQRLSDIQGEIKRLQTEATNTAAIIAAGLAKVDILAKSLPRAAPAELLEKDAPAIPPMVHTDIRAGQVSAFDPVDAK